MGTVGGNACQPDSTRGGRIDIRPPPTDTSDAVKEEVDYVAQAIIKRFSVHLLAALILVALLVLPDHLYALMEPGYQVAFKLKTVKWMFLFAVLMMGMRHRFAFFSFLVLFSLLEISQLFHFAYFGTQISPLEVHLLFSEWGEIWLSLISILPHLAYPALSVMASGAIAYKLWTATNQKLIPIPFSPILLTALLCVLPYRAYKSHDSQAFYPNPSAYSLTNSLYAVSYAAGHEFKHDHHVMASYKPYVIRSIRDQDLPNIVVVMGESLTYKHMHLFGYDRPTTPELDALKTNPDFVFKPAIAGGVATKVSLPQFFNIQRESGNLQHIIRYESNLLKMAKDHGYSTHFISAQTNNLMTYSGVEYADQFVTKEKMAGMAETEKDDVLLDYLRKIDLAKPSFIVLHQRNSHGPYEKSYPANFSRYPVTGIAYADYVRNSYDNSVGYTDHLLAQIIAEIRHRSTRPTYLFFTSDHAEMIGEHGKYGHGFLEPDVLRVPFLFYAVKGSQKQIDEVRAMVAPTHFEISKRIAEFIGYEVSNPNEITNRYFATGSDLAGSMGCVAIEKDDQVHDGWKIVPDKRCPHETLN